MKTNMTQKQFEVLMPIISSSIIDMIVEKRNVSEKKAIELLYSSKLYATLEKEETKLWYYSTPMLYSLLEEEWKSGTITYPDV